MEPNTINAKRKMVAVLARSTLPETIVIVVPKISTVFPTVQVNDFIFVSYFFSVSIQLLLLSSTFSIAAGFSIVTSVDDTYFRWLFFVIF